MVSDASEYTRHKGTPEDISYRIATEKETLRLRRLENGRSKFSGPISVIFIVFSCALFTNPEDMENVRTGFSNDEIDLCNNIGVIII